MKMVKLQDHEQAQAHVRIEPNKIVLVSYTTDVIIARKALGYAWVLEVTGLYSNTTKRHISWFMKEYFPSRNYYEIKEGMQDDLLIIAKLEKEVV